MAHSTERLMGKMESLLGEKEILETVDKLRKVRKKLEE